MDVAGKGKLSLVVQSMRTGSLMNQPADGILDKRQINYGSGKAVNAETKTADAGSPICVRWHPGSHVDIQTSP